MCPIPNCFQHRAISLYCSLDLTSIASLMPFTDEATFTRNGTSKTRNSHGRSHDIPRGL
jgi:hypothetical protein